jgi:hypothetical protein
MVLRNDGACDINGPAARTRDGLDIRCAIKLETRVSLLGVTSETADIPEVWRRRNNLWHTAVYNSGHGPLTSVKCVAAASALNSAHAIAER